MSNLDRMGSILFFIKTIDECIHRADYITANLNFAKLVEAMRQQNEYLGNVNPELVKDAEKNYAEFRKKYGLEYPIEFLPPETNEVTKIINEIEFSSTFMVMYETMYNMYGMQIEENLNHLLKLKMVLNRNLTELKNLQKHLNYKDHIIRAIEFYNKNHESTQIGANIEQINCITTPDKFAEQEFFNGCLLNCFENFHYKWNLRIESLKRKDAIAKRLSYLVEETTKYFEEAKRNRNMKLLDQIEIVLNDYHKRINNTK
jgi:hypothetical protein